MVITGWAALRIYANQIAHPFAFDLYVGVQISSKLSNKPSVIVKCLQTFVSRALLVSGQTDPSAAAVSVFAELSLQRRAAQLGIMGSITIITLPLSLTIYHYGIQI